jgi:3-dehydroquinate dehydratase type I
LKYLSKALQWGVEFIDVEYILREDFVASLLRRKGNTKVIISHHDFTGYLDWMSGDTYDIYKRCSLVGDVVQIAGVSQNLNDTFEVQKFRNKAASENLVSPPLIAFNTGRAGKLSRVLNPFLQATTHPVLPVSSAADQLSLVEVNG